jgi:ribosomal-protein-alanine N-acetyltransferase
MVRTDLDAVLAIEAQANPVPWKASDFEVFLGAPNSGPDAAAPGGPMAWVWAHPEVQAFACVVAAADEMELQAIAVARDRWGLGLGSALMEVLCARGRSIGCRNLHLEVREGNVRALEFYQRWGFAKAGRRPKYYRDNAEAALLLVKPL